MSNLNQNLNLAVGILGDGQLARMMCQEAHKLNIKTYVLTTSLTNPACLVNSNNFLVDSVSQKSILEFAQYCLTKNPNTILTLESEFINPDFLEVAQKELGIDIFPNTNNIRQIRDRKTQKQLINDNNLPTSTTYDFKNIKELTDHIDQTMKPLVLKKRLFGYDGYGTLILKPKQYNEHLSHDFKLDDWICEDFIDFRRELAVSFCRNQSGQICTFPWVETFQENSKCLWVKGPIPTNDKMTDLETKIVKSLEAINYIGFITFELFETSNEILINELAPRVHNSAHYSLEALYLNQFKAHLYGVLNILLPKAPQVISPFAMYNLIAKAETKDINLPLTNNSYFLNWYEKTEARPGRKMGHLTCLASTFDEALLRLQEKAKDFNL